MQHMIFMKEMAWVICLTYCEDLKKKIVRIHFVFKETYGAIADRVFSTSAPICTGSVYLPMNMIFLSLF